MKVLFLNEILSFSLIPRNYPTQNDNLILSLRNENSNLVITPAITFSISDKLYIQLTSQPIDFKAQNKYEIELKNGSDIIYLGKLIVLESGTDIQNYKYGSQSDSKFKYI